MMEEKKLFCAQCGAELPDGASSCIRCGAKQMDGMGQAEHLIESTEQKEEEVALSSGECTKDEETAPEVIDGSGKIEHGMPQKKKKRILVLLIVMGVILLAAVITAVCLSKKSDKMLSEENAVLGSWEMYCIIDQNAGETKTVPGNVVFNKNKTGVIELGDELEYLFMWDYDRKTEDAIEYNIYFQKDAGVSMCALFQNTGIDQLNGKIVIYMYDGAYALVFMRSLNQQ